MSEKKTTITHAVLDAALGNLISGAKGTAAEDGAKQFKALFEDFRKQPFDVPYKDFTKDVEDAKSVIIDLKKQLADALDVKADSSAKPVITLGNVKYVVNHGAYPHSVKDIVGNPELAKEILKITGQKAISKL